MRIVHLVPGSGGTFYCENCLRDTALVQALRRRGHDVIMVPLYLPMFTDAADVAEDAPIFFGGINVFLQQQFSFFRKTPRWLDRLLDAPWLLRRAASKEGSTSAADLGPMTLSMLRGDAGHQEKELHRLVHWMKHQERPDVVHISNALLLGLAADIKEALDVPVVCSLQDEDTWLDAMGSPYDKRCWEAMSTAAARVDAFVSVSQWYAEQMQTRMGLPGDQIHVAPLGIEVDDADPNGTATGPPVIGFLSRMSESQGLGCLVDAFVQLKARPGFSALRLRATGGVTPADQRFIHELETKLKRHGLDGDVDFLDGFQKEERRAFLQSISVLSVPVIHGEAFGAFILEALAQGVPVVQPRVGAFPEVVEATGGGLLYDPNAAGALEAALAELLENPDRARELGTRGRETVLRDYSIEAMAERMIAIYEKLLGSAAP